MVGLYYLPFFVIITHECWNMEKDTIDLYIQCWNPKKAVVYVFSTFGIIRVLCTIANFSFFLGVKREEIEGEKGIW